MNFPEGHMDLYLTEIGEPSDKKLRIVVAEAFLEEPSPLEIDNINLGNSWPIVVTNESRFFELNWDDYVAYVVRNESFWQAEPQEPQMTKNFYRRVNSAFLQFVSTTTFADDYYPEPLQHWALSVLNHCVDVVSVQPPRIGLIKAKGC